MIRSNPHTHTNYVDGKSPAREQIEAALQLGFVSLGFSEHAPEGDPKQFCGLTSEDRDRYVAEINALKKEYEGRLRVWLGMEIDRISDESGEGLDYFIGASHYFLADGAHAGVDGDADRLEAFVNAHFGGNWKKAVETYFEEYAASIERRPPSIIAHFDLIRKNNFKRHWFEEDTAFIACGKAAMERMIRCCDLMELNLGGLLRSGQKTPYPLPELLAHWRRLGGRVIPSTDCHYSPLLAAPAMTEDYLREAGYREYVRLGEKDALFVTEKL